MELEGSKMEKRITILPVGILSALCLFLLVTSVGADPSKETPLPVYKDLRPQKPPFDPERIPDPFLSYFVRQGQQATAKAEAEVEKLEKEKKAAAEKLKELLVARTELQKLAIAQLTLTAIVQAEGMAWAMVRDPKGRGFVLKKGTRIGTAGGVVDRIARNEKKVIIKEPYLEKELYLKFKNVEMKLPDQVYE